MTTKEALVKLKYINYYKIYNIFELNERTHRVTNALTHEVVRASGHTQRA